MHQRGRDRVGFPVPAGHRLGQQFDLRGVLDVIGRDQRNSL